MTVRAKKIKFINENSMSQSVHDVISSWLTDLDNCDNKDEKIIIKKHVIELEQVINKSGKPQIYFKNRNGKWSEKIIIEDGV